MQDRFRRSLHQPETLVIVAGYSFGDQHLNELIFDAAARRQRSEFVILCYESIPKTLDGRARITPNLQVASGGDAIIGGVRANWKPPEDAPSDLWYEGKFGLRDFGKLAAYLARSAGRQPDDDTELPDTVEKALGNQADKENTKDHT